MYFVYEITECDMTAKVTHFVNLDFKKVIPLACSEYEQCSLDEDIYSVQAITCKIIRPGFLLVSRKSQSNSRIHFSLFLIYLLHLQVFLLILSVFFLILLVHFFYVRGLSGILRYALIITYL